MGSSFCIYEDGVCYQRWQTVMHLHRQKLVENLSSEELVDHLWRDDIIDETARQEILSLRKKPLEMNSLLVDKLLHLKPWEFVLFIQFLDDTGQEHIANLLGEQGKLLYISV